MILGGAEEFPREVDAPGGTRTHDLRVKSPLLYQLSYRRANLLAAETYMCR